MPRVSLARASQDDVRVDFLDLPEGATLGDAIALAADAGLLSAAEREALAAGALASAVHGRLRPPSRVLRADDRIELLGPLTVDPKIARQRRVAHRRSTQARDKWSGDGR